MTTMSRRRVSSLPIAPLLPGMKNATFVTLLSSAAKSRNGLKVVKMSAYEALPVRSPLPGLATLAL